jgi:hypothetical protein
MLLNGAKHGLLDPMTGVSSNVMTGQMFLGGTNLCQVHLDLKEMERLNTAAELLQETKTSEMEDIERQFADVMEKDRASEDCSAANITITNYLGAMPTMKVESKCNMEEDGYDMGF